MELDLVCMLLYLSYCTGAHHDMSASPCNNQQKPLVIGDTVRVRDRGKWKPAKIVDILNQSNPRSDIVRLPTGREWRRNRRDILKTREINYFREDGEELDFGNDDNQEPPDAGRMPLRRGLRIRQRPHYWHDYHYYN